MISALFEDIATRVCSVDLQDITVFTHDEHLTSFGNDFCMGQRDTQYQQNLPKHMSFWDGDSGRRLVLAAFLVCDGSESIISL